MNKRTERSPVGVGIREGRLVNFLTDLKSIFVSISITAVIKGNGAGGGRNRKMMIMRTNQMYRRK